MNNNIEFYKFDYSKYINLLKQNQNIDPKLLVINIIKSYNVEKFDSFTMLKSLLNDKLNYPNIENHFEYSAQFLFLKYLRKRGENMNSPEILTLKENMSKTWQKI